MHSFPRQLIGALGALSVFAAALAACGTAAPAAAPTSQATAISTAASAPASEVTAAPAATSAPAAPATAAPTLPPDPTGVVLEQPTAAQLPTAAPEAGLAAPYEDDRSGPVQVVSSFYNAINRREYARAYSYWQPGGDPDQPLPSFADFTAGYSTTVSVQLTTGQPLENSGAGQIYANLPVAIVSELDSGATQTFVGCYELHLTNPGMQTAPPFEPMSIISANIRQVENGANTTDLMAQACPNP